MLFPGRAAVKPALRPGLSSLGGSGGVFWGGGVAGWALVAGGFPELPDAPAEAPSHLGQLAGPEDGQHDQQDYD